MCQQLMQSRDLRLTQPWCCQAISFETDAYAIIDTFRWIEPKIYTLVIGEAFGNAALIVAAGEPCRLWALADAFATIRLRVSVILTAACPPRGVRRQCYIRPQQHLRRSLRILDMVQPPPRLH